MGWRDVGERNIYNYIVYYSSNEKHHHGAGKIVHIHHSNIIDLDRIMLLKMEDNTSTSIFYRCMHSLVIVTTRKLVHYTRKFNECPKQIEIVTYLLLQAISMQINLTGTKGQHSWVFRMQVKKHNRCSFTFAGRMSSRIQIHSTSYDQDAVPGIHQREHPKKSNRLHSNKPKI